jgi:rod shape-determining protein MreC
MVLVLIILLYTMESTNWQRQDMVSIGKPLREITYPIQQGIKTVTDGFQNFAGYFQDNEDLRNKNEQLQAELDKQQGQLIEMADIKRENERLAAFLDYQNNHQDQYQLKLAQVIGQNPNNWSQMLIINQGSEDGLAVDMPVITVLGLAGRIVSITPHTAEVLLLVDNESAVGARVLETRVTPGVVQGIGQANKLEMIHLSHDEDIMVGNTIITSGFNSYFPKGVPIGVVEEVILDANGLTKKVKIKPFVDFNRLEEVMVIYQTLTNTEAEQGNLAEPLQGGVSP